MTSIEYANRMKLPEMPCEAPAVLVALERRMIVAALNETRGNITAAAKLLGMEVRHVRYRMEIWSITKPVKEVAVAEVKT